ncbi:MAG: adenosylhomocysteinase, partial [Nitrososphaeraceae archaeon]
LKAKLDGYSVSTMVDAATTGDIFVTTTGCKDVVNEEHVRRMKNGAILANAGHFNVEISMDAIDRSSVSKENINEHTTQFELSNGNKIYLIGEGRLVNLAAAEGHPSEVMDMSFANQFMSVLKLAQTKSKMEPIVYDIEKSQDQEIAFAKLASMGVKIDKLTSEQKNYIQGYSEGT